MCFKRVVAWGDGWMPIRATPEDIKMGRATLDKLCEAAGRDPRSIEITVFGEASDPEAAAEVRRGWRQSGDREAPNHIERCSLDGT